MGVAPKDAVVKTDYGGIRLSRGTRRGSDAFTCQYTGFSCAREEKRKIKESRVGFMASHFTRRGLCGDVSTEGRFFKRGNAGSYTMKHRSQPHVVLYSKAGRGPQVSVHDNLVY